DRFFGRVYDNWHGIISDHSARSLTKELDRLPAISGLAEEVARATGSTYVAGFWKDQLMPGLNWKIVEDESSGAPKRPDKYYAPSWSWGSVQSAVTFQESVKYTEDYVADIDTVELSYTEHNLFGSLVNGSMLVSGPVSRIKAWWDDDLIF